MKISVVAYQTPEPEGTSPGRALYALCEGLIALGHDLSVWAWGHIPPANDLPAWCEYRPVSPPPRTRINGLRDWISPQSWVRRAGWVPPGEGVAIADDVPSYAAIERAEHAVATFNFITRFDAPALRRFNRLELKHVLAERRVARRGVLTTAYSERVAFALGRECIPLPIAYPVPDEVLQPVERPVAALLANWGWPPNRAALQILLDAWPEVTSAVPGATLLLAGRESDTLSIGASGSIKLLGEVGAAADVLSQAAVIAFPCPATSGPKVKVLEAIAYGVPVVTTPAGVEGLQLAPEAGAIVSSKRHFARALITALRSPELRARLATRGRASVEAAHAPIPAATAKVAAIRSAFGDL